MRRFAGLLLGALSAAALAAPLPASAAAPPARDWRASVRELAVSHFKNPAWGYSHCLRDYALAKELAAADPDHDGTLTKEEYLAVVMKWK